MNCFIKRCENTSEQLGRELQQEEVDFLYWIHYLQMEKGFDYQDKRNVLQQK